MKIESIFDLRSPLGMMIYHAISLFVYLSLVKLITFVESKYRISYYE
jgi:hypothetical protein|uniref:Uncharacterized protein n=1 Tax=Picea glauca TaxID=3330 RepID=A0A101LXE6_PICGL|nr:hypothetical protein ABT39_MTgene6125 [Picea glauca]